MWSLPACQSLNKAPPMSPCPAHTLQLRRETAGPAGTRAGHLGKVGCRLMELLPATGASRVKTLFSNSRDGKRDEQHREKM